MTTTLEQLANDISTLQNDSLTIKKLEDNIYDFKSQSISKGLTGEVTISFSGRALLDEKNKIVTYWDMIKKSSVGAGGSNMGFYKDSYFVKGLERSGSGEGLVPGGEKYSYDYGKVRELVRAIVEKNGWQFKVKIIKPKWWKGFFSS